jgi:hypothetical protein
VTDVIVLKDWVPNRVRDSYLTEDEIDALNEEYNQSQLEPGNPPSSLDTQAQLVEKAAAKLASIDRPNLEKWLHRIPTELLVELIED